MLKIRRKYILDTIIITWMLVFILFQTWAHLALNISQNAILLLMMIRLFIDIKEIKMGTKDIGISVGILIFLILLCVNIYQSPHNYLVVNVQTLILPWMSYIYFAHMVKRHNDFLINYFYDILYPLNFYLIANAILMIIQLSGNYFLVDTQTSNTYYLDLVAGLMGANGTHRVTMFGTLVLLLDLKFLYNSSELKKRNLKVLLVLGIVLLTYVSLRNDNNSYFLFIGFSLVEYYIFMQSTKIKSSVLRYWKLIGLALVCVICIPFLSRIPAFDTVVYKFQRAFSSLGTFLSGGTSIKQGDERMMLFMTALSEGGAFGKGFGAIKMFSEESIITVYGCHFGMSSVQSLVYMMGIVPYIWGIVLVAVEFVKQKKHSIHNVILLFAFIFLSAYYTQVFTVFNLSILTAMCLMTLSMIREDCRERLKNRENRSL